MGEKIGALLELTNTYENPSMLNFRRNLSASTETDSDKTNEMKTQNLQQKNKKRAKKRFGFTIRDKTSLYSSSLDLFSSLIFTQSLSSVLWRDRSE